MDQHLNGSRLGIPKHHWTDAACVADVERLSNLNLPPLVITACGRGSRKRTRFTLKAFIRKTETAGLLAPYQ